MTIVYKSVSKVFFFSVLGILTLTLILTGIMHFLHIKKGYKESLAIQRRYHTRQSEQIIKQEVDKAIFFIENYYNAMQRKNGGILSPDELEKVQSEILENIGKIRFGEDGYIFIVSYDGVTLMNDTQPRLIGQNLWELTDTNGVKVIQEERKAVENPDGDYIRYVWNKPGTSKAVDKISFIKGFSQWEWMIGAGIYIDDLDESLAKINESYDKELKKTIIFLLTIFVSIFIVDFILAGFISRVLKKNINTLLEFFKKAPESQATLNVDALSFKEFRRIALSLNKMIVQRRELFEKIELSKKRLQSFLNSATEIFVQTDSKLNIITLNDAGLKAYGQGAKRADIIGRNLSELSTEDFVSSGRYDKYMDVIISGKAIIFEELKTGHKYDFEYISLKAFKVDEGLGLIISDITERKKNIESLKENEEKLDILLNASNDVAFLAERDGTITVANAMMRKRFGTENNIVGRNIYDFMPSERINNRVEKFKKVYESKKAIHWEDSWGEMYVHNSVFPIFDKEGNVKQMAVFSRDISGAKQAKLALEESELRLQTLINSTPDIIFFKDGHGRWQVANESGLKLFCLENVDYSGKTDAELAEYTDSVYKKSFLTCSETDENTWAAKKMVRIEEYIPDRYGELKIFDVLKVPLFEDDGSRKGMVILGRDITDFKKAEDKLKQSEERNSAFLKAIPDLILVFNRDGVVIDFNTNDVKRLLLPPEQFIGKKISDVLPPDLQAETRDKLNKVFTSGEIQVFQYKLLINNKYQYFEARMVLKSQEEALIIVRDISERKFALEELTKLSVAVEQSPVSIVITNLDGNIEYVNPKFCSVTGYSYKEAVGQNPRVLKSGKQSDAYYKDLWETILAGKIWTGEFHNKTKSGDYYWEKASIAPIFDENGIKTHFIAIKEDITETKGLEEQLLQSQKLEGIGQLAGGIAHDFNNILAALYGFSDVALMETTEGSKVHNALVQIQKANKRAAKLVRQILAFSRKQVYTPINLNINTTILDLNKMLQRLIGEDIEIKMVLSSIESNIFADPSQIEQIVINLFVNARDAIKSRTDNNDKQICIRTENIIITESPVSSTVTIREGSYILISISDTGIGMDEKVIQQIFEPFYTTKEVGKGTGLGLSTVYGIVKQNKGYITVYSEPGTGTTFKIYWPSIIQAIKNEKEDDIIESTYNGSETILYVEDDKMVREVSYDALKHRGYTVIACSNGKEALRKAEELDFGFDIVVTDVTMPKMGGIELTEKILKKVPNMKVIFCSGYNENLALRKKIAGKNIPFLSKPFNAIDMAKMIRELMEDA